MHKEPEGGYTVSVPVLPDCITYGENVDEALTMAREAIELYIEELNERGEDVPVNTIGGMKKGTLLFIPKLPSEIE